MSLNTCTNAKRLTFLRQWKQVSQTQLAKSLGISQVMLSKMENGLSPISVETQTKLRMLYKLPETFFYVQSGTETLGEVTFRKKATVTVKDQNQVTALLDEAARIWKEVSERSGYKRFILPDAEIDDAEDLADWFRDLHGLKDDAPIRNATRLVEASGVGVVAELVSNQNRADFSGACRPNSVLGRPLVATVYEMPGAVQRMTVLHEYAHWIFDRDLLSPITSTRDPVERRAFHFAGAALLPKDVAKSEISESLNLNGYLRLKSRYGISVIGAVKRGHTLGLISDDRYRSLNIQMSSRGWKTEEPVFVEQEQPQLISQAINRVWGSNLKRAAHDLGAPEVLLRQWIGKPPALTSESDIHDNVIPFKRKQARQ